MCSRSNPILTWKCLYYEDEDNLLVNNYDQTFKHALCRLIDNTEGSSNELSNNI